MKKELFKTIVADLRSDEFFSKYKYIRADNTLGYHNGSDGIYVDLQHWRDYWDDNCVIRPLYFRHFDILQKWFEKYSVIPLQSQRRSAQIMDQNDLFGQENEIEFKYDFSDYEVKFRYLSTILKENIPKYVEKYKTIHDYYNKIVCPRVFGDVELLDTGAEWIFRYLTAGFLLDRENYPILKDKILKHAEWMYNRHEPNIVEYYDRMDEIISYMENNVKL